MAISVVMPALEMAQDTGKLVSWLKQEGEPVRKGEMLLEVETDKAVVEVEAAADGILAGVTAKPGDVVHVGHTIAWLVKPGAGMDQGEGVLPVDNRAATVRRKAKHEIRVQSSLCSGHRAWAGRLHCRADRDDCANRNSAQVPGPGALSADLR